MRISCLATLMALGWSLSAWPADPRDDLDTVVVAGKRLPVSRTVMTFVTGITRLEGELVGRWRDPLCPIVAGASDELNAYLRARILEVAQSVPLRTAKKANCDPNLFVVITPDPDDFVAQWKARDAGMFRWRPRRGVERSDSGPVRTWHSAELEPADGSPVEQDDGQPPSYKMRPSRIESTVQESLSVAFILVDARAIANVTPQQLGDYLAMRGFAKVDVTANFGETPTILRLFAGDGAAPAALTDFDLAFLNALYRTSYSPVHQRTAIAARMTRELAKR